MKWLCAYAKFTYYSIRRRSEMDDQAKKKWAMRQRNFSETDWWSVSSVLSLGKHRLHRGTPITDDLDDDTACRASVVRALHESTAIADRIREAIAGAPPKLVMLALSDLLEHLTHLVMVESDREQTPFPRVLS